MTNRRAEKRKAWVEGMTREERTKLLAELTEDLARSAPTIEAVESDPLKLLLVAGAEFIRRYFPEASTASLHIAKRPPAFPSDWHVHIPCAVPKGGA